MKLFSRRQRQTRPENWFMVYYVRTGEYGNIPEGNLIPVGRIQAMMAAETIRLHVGKDKVVVFSSEKMFGPYAETTEIIADRLGVKVEEACFHQEFHDYDVSPELVDYLAQGKNHFVLVENGRFLSTLLRKYPRPSMKLDFMGPVYGSVQVMKIELTKAQLGGIITEKHFV